MTTPDPAGAGRDVVDVLSDDHAAFLELLAQIRACTDHAEQKELADTLVAELVRHSVAEEMWVYPAMKRHLPDGEAKVRHDVEEHRELEVLMKRLERTEPGDAAFTSTVAGIEAVLRDHVQDEEADQFPGLRAHVPHEELITMARRVDKAKKVSPTRPHPGAPNSELFHKTVGLGAGMVDRLRDALQHRNSDPAS